PVQRGGDPLRGVLGPGAQLTAVLDPPGALADPEVVRAAPRVVRPGLAELEVEEAAVSLLGAPDPAADQIGYRGLGVRLIVHVTPFVGLPVIRSSGGRFR